MTVIARYAIVFNPNDSYVQIDENKELEPQTWGAGNLDHCAQLISDGRLIELDPDTIDHKSNPDVILVKEQVAELNKDVKKEQRKEDRAADKKANKETEK